MSRQKQLLVGTGKGLILYEKKGNQWQYQGDRFLGLAPFQACMSIHGLATGG